VVSAADPLRSLISVFWSLQHRNKSAIYVNFGVTNASIMHRKFNTRCLQYSYGLSFVFKPFMRNFKYSSVKEVFSRNLSSEG
jgi:hypothetical protein